MKRTVPDFKSFFQPNISKYIPTELNLLFLFKENMKKVPLKVEGVGGGGGLNH